MIEGLFQPLHLLVILLVSDRYELRHAISCRLFLGSLCGNEEAEKALTPTVGL